MGSLRAKAVSFVLRHTLKKRLSRAHDTDAIRRALGGGPYRVPGSVGIEAGEVAGVPGERVTPAGGGVCGTLLYLHGGGYIACSPSTHRPATCAFAGRGFRVFAPDYRRGPEHPYPAAVDDARAVLKVLCDEYGPGGLVVAGDSAGGGLALAALIGERDAGRALPAAAALFSPWTDLAVTGTSITANERSCAMFTGEVIRRAAAMYLGGADPREGLASPLYADLAGLPPLLVHAAQGEVLRDDSVRLVRRAQDAGVAATLRLWPDVPHVWQLFHPVLPEGRASLEEAAEFLQGHLSAGAEKAATAGVPA